MSSISGRQVVGVDLHLHRSVVGLIDVDGSQLGWVRIDNDPRALVRECRKAGRGAPVAIEATYGWYWAVDALQAARFEVHLAHPYGMKAMRARKRVKTDPRDAFELANLLRLGSLPEAYIAPPELRELRELVRHRQQLVKTSTAVKAGVRALLAKRGIRLAATDLDGDAGSEQLAAVSLPGTYAIRLAAQRRLMLVLAEEVAATELELAIRLRHHPGYCRLLGLKGIGPVLAAIFIAEIGDITRFETAAALCCWAGITPRHYESDKTVRRGHISKEGAKLVRWAAVEAIQRSCEPAVKKVKDDLIARRGAGARNIAKTAAARRMLEAVYYTLHDGEARFLTAQPAAA
ncbi:IS110 family transposase [Mycobacterium sp.]|uniref:IS110 family transposase n=1 Tax=Mycobacterium sp. TaxID=1785 RepID=UPI002BA9B894|nr:IS110 family transposase [Mycobacterium sp.]HTQ19418.1 IS110 family transposase [Mycobacterium sp.]